MREVDWEKLARQCMKDDDWSAMVAAVVERDASLMRERIITLETQVKELRGGMDKWLAVAADRRRAMVQVRRMLTAVSPANPNYALFNDIYVTLGEGLRDE